MSAQRLRLVILCATLLGIFAVYAPAVRLMLFHDDALNVTWMNGYNLVTIFAIDGKTGASARPIANELWLLVRELFGWYIPALIHFWNVLLHVLNVALVASLATVLGRLFGLHGVVFPLLSALSVGLFPFSYQAILWAGAIYHPVVAACGLLAVHTYRFARTRNRLWMWLLSGVLLIAACLSHESGFVFGAIVLGIEVMFVISGRRPFRVGALALCGIGILYAIGYRLLFPGLWQVQDSVAGAGFIGRTATNGVYFMQAVVSWMLILMRSQIGLTAASPAIISALFVVGIVPALILLGRARLVTLGLFALCWWAIAVAPASLLAESYVQLSPRLLYVASIGIALFWACVTAALIQHSARGTVKGLVVIPVAVLFAWCIPYIADRLNETARLTPAMKMIDADLRTSDPSDKVLLINMPYWSAPAYPAFLIGAEGMPIFQSAGAPPWTWLAANSGTRRTMTYVRHDISLTRGDHFFYGIPGEIVNDVVLRRDILASNYIYRFDYDSPGLRVRRLAIIQMSTQNGLPGLAMLSQGTAKVSIQKAQAYLCQGAVHLDITWAGVQKLMQPAGVFVHGISTQGQQVFVADRDLLEGYLPLDVVPSGVTISETRVINTTPDNPAVSEIRLGVYSRVNGERFTATQDTGVRWDGDEVVIPVGATGTSQSCDQ